MSILGVDREHDIRQDKLFTALIVSIVVHILLFIFFSQLAPLYRTPGILKKTYEVLLLGKAETDKGEDLSRKKEDEKKKVEKILKTRQEPEIEKVPPPPPEEPVQEEAPAPPIIPEPMPLPVEPKAETVKKVITSKPSPVKAKSVPSKAKAAAIKEPEKPEKTVYSSKSDAVEKGEGKAAEGAKSAAKEGVPAPAGQSYMELIKTHVIKNLKYPPAAKINRIEGDVSVSFLISKDGDSHDINIKRASGFPILDDGALRAIRKSEPFPPFEGAEDVVIVYMGGEQYASVSFTISFSLDYITMGTQ